LALRDLSLKQEYRSDKDDVVTEFFIPCLTNSIQYDRTIQYITVKSLSTLTFGLENIQDHHAKIRLISGHRFSTRDLDAIIKLFDHHEKRRFNGNLLMDSSDGLSTTLNEMSNQSKKKFVITKMPSENDVFDFASSSRLNVNDLILNGGEEYEIVATVNASNLPKIKKYAKKHKMKLYEIGYVTKGKGVFHKKNGKLIKIKDGGWQHLQKS